jgi:hypothetical protein
MNVALKFSGHICGAIVSQESRPKGKQRIYLYVSVESYDQGNRRLHGGGHVNKWPCIL